MLGLKLAQVTALPAMWGKLSKWRSRAQPLCEAADPEGTELHQAPADTTDARFTAEEYMTTLLKIEADILALAAKAGPRHTAEKMQLRKLAHKIAMLAANAKASSAKPDVPAAGLKVPPTPPPPAPHSSPTVRAHQHGHCTVMHRHAQLRLCAIGSQCHANTPCAQLASLEQSALAGSDLVGESEPNEARARAVHALHAPPPS